MNFPKLTNESFYVRYLGPAPTSGPSADQTGPFSERRLTPQFTQETSTVRRLSFDVHWVKQKSA